MAQARVKDGQTWWDVAIEVAGAWEAGIDLALAHSVSMTSNPPLSTEIKTSKQYNRPMELYCLAEGVSPATLRDEIGLRLQIFSPIFNVVFQ